MTAQEILSHLDGVKGGDGQWIARCPAHGDTHQSLSVGVGKDGKVLLRCHAGCRTEDIAQAMGLEMKDLFVEDTAEQAFRPAGKSPVVAVYNYRDDAGNLLAQKLRKADKSFSWRRPDGHGGWIYNRKGVPHRLYIAGELSGIVYVVEGEKDADNLHNKIGGCAASGADGAGPGKWRKEYTKQLAGRSVVILQDNDGVGRDYAQETAAALHGAAKSVKLLDLSGVWPDIPEHGDISDMIEALGAEETARRLVELVRAAPEWEPDAAAETDSFFSYFKTLDEFEEEEAQWIVPGWVPEGQITLMSADGGVGKTTLWCHILAALSNGSACILDPPGFTREPAKVAFLTNEDSVRKKLRKKLRLAGANMQNIVSPDFMAANRDGALRNFKFGSKDMARFLRHFKFVLCAFDPVQGFIPPKVNMGSRNEMRDCMAPLVALGEELGTTFLVISHTNKRKGASGRDRIADSADLWDISRSVLMAGFTEEQGVRYLSNEKNNYAELQETVLFTIDGNGHPHREGTSWKRDKDFVNAAELSKSAPKREDCKAFILKTLADAGGAMPTADLDSKAREAGYSFTGTTLAKRELKKDGAIKYFTTGSAKSGDRVWHIQALKGLPGGADPDGGSADAGPEQAFIDLPDDGPTPFDPAKL